MSRTDRYISVLLVAAPLLFFFGPALFQDRMLAFRDTAHFYEPLFQWTSQQWRHGHLPIWNPHDSTGLPLLADVTSSLFYPGKLFFCLPWDVAVNYKLYVVAHVLLSALATYRLARSWRVGTWGAALAAMAYAYGGNVLFQHCNVVFLVGAAWLPVACNITDRMLRQRSVVWAIWLGVVLALMVLGGDPQAAYHAGVLATAYAIALRFCREPTADSATSVESPASSELLNSGEERKRLFVETTPRFFQRSLFLLATAALIGLLLSAVQVWPALEAALQSSRGETGGQSVFANPLPGTHSRHIYEFSVGPWRWLELIWPNLGGRLFPVDHRWFEMIPQEQRIWTPSLYLGLLPFLLGLLACRWRSGSIRQRWLTWSALVSLLASLGWFGLGWVGDEILFAVTRKNDLSVGIGSPVGGVYWWMQLLLPGYSYFRYPAKLLVVGSLMFSVLAGMELDRVFGGAASRIRPMLAIVGVISAVGALVTFVIWPTWSSWGDSFHVNVLWYGPLDPAGATLDLLIAFLHAAMVCAVFWLLTRNLSEENRTWRSSLLLTITAMDLIVSHGWLVPSEPKSLTRNSPIWLTKIAAADQAHVAEQGAHRIYRSPLVEPPRRWRSSRSTERLAENLRWEHESFFPRHHLPWNVTQVESFGSVESRDFATFLAVVREFSKDETRTEDSRKVAAILSARWIIAPPDGLAGHPPDFRLADADEFQSDMSLVKNERALPRAWIVHDCRAIREANPQRRSELQTHTEHVLLDSRRQLREFLHTAVVETNSLDEWGERGQSQSAAEAKASEKEDAGEACRIVRDEPCCVELVATLNRPGLLVLNDLFFPGWYATSQTSVDPEVRSLPIVRTNRIMRGVWLPAGEHRVTLEYRPSSFAFGAVVSGAAWLVVILGAGIQCLNRKKR